VLKILILPLNFPEIGGLGPKLSIFGRKFADRNNIFRQPKTEGEAIAPPCPRHTTPLLIIEVHASDACIVLELSRYFCHCALDQTVWRLRYKIVQRLDIK